MSRALRAQLGPLRDVLFPRPCKRKQRYSEFGARHVLKKRQPLEAAELHVYRCPYCDGWHLTKLAQPSDSDFEIRDPVANNTKII